jgi:hypothetical protein
MADPFAERHTYIPPHVEQAMAKQMQSMPAHLQRYVGSNKSGYIPLSAQKAIAQHMEKTMPSHLKQYSGAYVQQHIIQPSSTTNSVQSTPAAPHLPPPDPLRLDHSIAGAGQYTVDPSELPTGRTEFQPEQTSDSSESPEAPYGPNPPAPPRSDPYEFITAPATPQKRASLSLGGNSSMAKRVLIVVGGGSLLLIIIILLASLIFGGGSTNTESLISIAQEQTELDRVSGIGVQNAVSQNIKNFASSTQISIFSDQQQLLAFLQQHGTKLKSKELAATASAKTDTALNTAIAASTFDETFTSIMQTDLKTYEQTLKQTFIKTKDPAVRQLLSTEYSNAQLLLEQISSTD